MLPITQRTYMLQLKIAFALSMICFFCSCDLSRNLSKNVGLKEQKSSAIAESNVNIPNNDVSNYFANNSNQVVSQNVGFTSSYQTKARRKKIDFPDDCRSSISANEENRQLQITCANALNAVLLKLPDADCEYASLQRDGGKLDLVIDDDRMLTYTIQETDINDFDGLVKRLETTRNSIISGNKFYNQGKLSPGQEIKYQKSHLEKSANDWFEGYDIDFYSMLPNKYLVKVRCNLGAYNESNVYLFYDESAIPAKVEVLEFPTLEITRDEDSDVARKVEKVTTEIVKGRYFNQKTKELVCFYKAHGIGDAGDYARYSFPNGKPKLKEYRARFVWSGREYTPDEVFKNSPKTWKRYYPK